MSSRLLSFVVLTGLLFGCGDQSKKNTEEEASELSLSADCGDTTTTSSRNRTTTTEDFGDGSDGEFYLAHGDLFQLQERTYNFTNVNLDQGSLLTIASELSGSSGTIRINSLGVCNFLGDVELSGYRGSFFLNCNSSLTVGATFHVGGNLILSTSEAALISEESTTNISEVTLSSAGSIDISGAELLTLSTNVIGGEVTYSLDANLVEISPVDLAPMVTTGELLLTPQQMNEASALTIRGCTR